MVTLFDKDGRLKPNARKIAMLLAIFYAFGIGLMCFTPQTFGGMETPGIKHYGRLVVLLTPFNSLVHLGAIQSFGQLVWVIGQNMVNILLLFPLIFLLLCLLPSLRRRSRACLLAFGLSLFIELTQLFLDWLIAANRVFEIDDLWTNTLGGLLAFWLFDYLFKKAPKA
ncbi:VanZ family protein [Streptococcus ferus]|uniref:VanZ family protein n=2 Tax=Streptococcus ferus TaxID=1345 RepID=UPI00359FAD1D